MADINEVKEKAKGAIENVAEITRGFAEKVADTAKFAAKSTKLTVDISAEKDGIRRAYSEIGKHYYETRKGEGDEILKGLCDKISLAKLNIEKLEAERSELKDLIRRAKEADIEIVLEEPDSGETEKPADSESEHKTEYRDQYRDHY
ncbi:MAG: hypothetical protein FWG32_00940 [Oscillospiraceae bacterium]|nr:hypothetical protein [Oscillospiraceae bacterium]